MRRTSSATTCHTPVGRGDRLPPAARCGASSSRTRLWLKEYRFDGLRFDAVHAIADAGLARRDGGRDPRARSSPDRHVHLVLENEGNDADHLRRRLRRAVERRCPPRPARPADRRDRRLLQPTMPTRRRSSWRAASPKASSTRASRRPIATASRAATPSARPAADRLRAVPAEPRPDRQPRVRRPADRAGRSRGAARPRSPCCCSARRSRCCSWARSGRAARRSCSSPITTAISPTPCAKDGAASSPASPRFRAGEGTRFPTPTRPRPSSDSRPVAEAERRRALYRAAARAAPRGDRAAPGRRTRRSARRRSAPAAVVAAGAWATARLAMAANLGPEPCAVPAPERRAAVREPCRRRDGGRQGRSSGAQRPWPSCGRDARHERRGRSSQRARAVGIAVDWTDVTGRSQRVPTAIAAPPARRAAATAHAPAGVPPLVTATVGQRIVLRRRRRRPAGRAARSSRAARRVAAVCAAASLPAIASARLSPPALRRPRDHRWRWRRRAASRVGDIAPGRRLWGLAVQIYGLRRRATAASATPAALGHLAEAAARARRGRPGAQPGAQPVPRRSAPRFSPYSPSSRLFLNPLLMPIPAQCSASERVDDRTSRRPTADRLARRAARRKYALLRQPVRRLRRQPHAARARLRGASSREGGATPAPAMPASRPSRPDRRRRRRASACSCNGSPTRAFAAAQQAAQGRRHADRPDRRSRGRHGPRRQPCLVAPLRDLLTGLSHRRAARPVQSRAARTGASPRFSPRPCRRTASRRSSRPCAPRMRHAGGVRIDHAMGLLRLWVVPHGAPPARGRLSDLSRSRTCCACWRWNRIATARS